MGLRINTNTQALASQRFLGINKRAQDTSLEHMASGTRINRAGDDAAGLAISEKLKGDFSDLISTNKSDTYLLNDYPDTPDLWNASCNSLNISDLTRQANSDLGTKWMEGSHSNSAYYHTNLPNQRSCKKPSGRVAVLASSAHTAGVNVVMCDGSVRFVPNSISLATWRAMGSRNLGEINGD